MACMARRVQKPSDLTQAWPNLHLVYSFTTARAWWALWRARLHCRTKAREPGQPGDGCWESGGGCWEPGGRCWEPGGRCWEPGGGGCGEPGGCREPGGRWKPGGCSEPRRWGDDGWRTERRRWGHHSRRSEARGRGDNNRLPRGNNARASYVETNQDVVLGFRHSGLWSFWR